MQKGDCAPVSKNNIIVYWHPFFFFFPGNFSCRDNEKGSPVGIWWDLCSARCGRIWSFSPGHIDYLWGLVHRLRQYHSLHQYPQVWVPHLGCLARVTDSFRFVAFLSWKSLNDTTTIAMTCILLSLQHVCLDDRHFWKYWAEREVLSRSLFHGKVWFLLSHWTRSVFIYKRMENALWV